MSLQRPTRQTPADVFPSSQKMSSRAQASNNHTVHINDDSSLQELFSQPNIPRDAKVVALILKSMGVEHYEPRVVNQLLEFIHRYTTEVLEDAQLYASHAEKSDVDLEDVRLAIQSRVNLSFTNPPPRELLMELAQKRNGMPLPAVAPTEVRLPQQQHCLVNPNYQVLQ